jgi:SAM-dependent methyltransferase
MDFNAIDWNAMWQEELKDSRWEIKSPRELWDKRADKFGKMVKDGQTDKSDYMSLMLNHIEIKPGWTLLDIGCGPGTLTIPLAKEAGSVTALDISSKMLERFKSDADSRGLSNIKYLNSSWQDAFANGQVGSHDVVVASRSLMSGDIKKAISNIAAITRQAAYLTFPIVHLPFDWVAYEAIGRGKKKYPPYIYVYNMLFQMGIWANVEILYSKVKVQFSSIEEAMDDLQWRTDPFTPDEKIRLRKFLEKKFAEKKESSVFTHEGQSVWALIWWRKVESGVQPG